MLVSELENSSLFNVISDDKIDYSHVHDSLYQCARAMLDKYKQKRMPSSEKLGVKILAVQAMLDELGKLPKSSLATRKTIRKNISILQTLLRSNGPVLAKFRIDLADFLVIQAQV